MPRFLPATYRTLLLVSVLVVVAFLLAVLFRNLKMSDESNALVEHTYTVLLDSDNLSRALADVEVGHLRFLISGQEERLAIYTTALAEVPAAQSELKRETADNPAQQARLRDLNKLIDERLKVIAARIEVRRKQGRAAAEAQANTDGGIPVGRRIRLMLGDLVTEEQALLRQRRAIAALRSRRTIQITAVGSVVLLALLLCIGYVLERDVVLRRGAEDEVRRSEILFRGLFDNASVGIAILSDEAHFQLVNSRFCEITGYSNDQILSRTFQSVISPDETAPFAFADFMKQTAAAGAGRKQRCLRADGSSAWVNLTVSSLPPDTGALNRFICVIEDIGARVQAEEGLQAANSSLRRSNEALQEFAYVVSHDLQEPLRTISMYSHLLSREYGGQLGEQGGKFLTVIADGTRRMQQLIESLLAYSQASGGDRQNYETVNLQELLQDTLEALRGRIEQEHALIESEPLPEVSGDPVRLHQVLQNLIGNALKYRRSDVRPEIRIGCRKLPAEWLLSVSDNGLGFPSESADKIFGIFKRLHGREISGTGVGLAVVKTVVERHGGKVWAESRGDNQGATFSFTIPIAENHHARQTGA